VWLRLERFFTDNAAAMSSAAAPFTRLFVIFGQFDARSDPGLSVSSEPIVSLLDRT
jgi:hypothetical protein